MLGRHVSEMGVPDWDYTLSGTTHVLSLPNLVVLDGNCITRLDVQDPDGWLLMAWHIQSDNRIAVQDYNRSRGSLGCSVLLP